MPLKLTQGPPSQFGPVFHATNPLPRFGALYAPGEQALNSTSAAATPAVQSAGGATAVHAGVGGEGEGGEVAVMSRVHMLARSK